MAEKKRRARRPATDRARQAKRRRRLRRAAGPVLVLVVAAVVAALVLGGGESSEPVEAGSPEQLAVGEEVFDANCATCHGEGLVGGLAGPPLLHEIYAPDHHPDSTIRAAIANGVQPHHWDFAGMPPIQGLSGQDVDAVIAYIRDVQEDEWGGDSP